MRISPRCLSALRHLAIRSSFAALAVLLALVATSCESSEAQPTVVIERVVEVTREVPAATSVAGQSESTPLIAIPEPDDIQTGGSAQQQPNQLILFDIDESRYAKLQAIAAKEGATLTLTRVKRSGGWDMGVPDPQEVPAIIVLAGYGGLHGNEEGLGINSGILVHLHSYVNRGGRLVFFVHPALSKLNTLLQDTFQFLVIPEDVTPIDSWELHVNGGSLWSHWKGLTIGTDRSPYTQRTGARLFYTAVALRSYFEPLDVNFPVTTIQSSFADKSRAASVLAKVGSGEALFITGFSAGDEGTRFRGYVNFLNDRSIDLWDNEEAAHQMIRWLMGLTEESDFLALPGNRTFDAASVLARFSTGDPRKGEERADASGEIIAQYSSGNADNDRVLDLLHTLSPELSLDERKRAADELAKLSGDDEWDDEEKAAVVSHLAALVTGEEVNSEGRIAAAHEIVALYRAGSLDSDRALGLMDTIAPGLSVHERKKAAGMLARLSAATDWEDADRVEAANEVFRLVTGIPLEAEKRIGAAVDLAGIGVKIFDTQGQFDDRDIDIATELIKLSLTGELTVESVESLLGLVH